MLELSTVNAFYGQSHILHDVRLAMGENARVAIVGRNGAGKTTLLKSIMNAGPRVAGAITFRSELLGDMPANRRSRRGLSLVPEDRRIFEHLTTYENLRIAQHGVGQGRARVDIDELLDSFPMLAALRNRLGAKMSGGQQQMLAVARGISARPYLLLLDEPTEGLAPAIVEELAEKVTSCCEKYGIALLLAEQSIWFARQCTNLAVVLDTGRIAFAGTWQDFDLSIDKIRRYLAF
jgi:ABC-type branched-subunit amino acid transport system ATPase component